MLIYLNLVSLQSPLQIFMCYSFGNAVENRLASLLSEVIETVAINLMMC